jgi:hypothetical protein
MAGIASVAIPYSVRSSSRLCVSRGAEASIVVAFAVSLLWSELYSECCLPFALPAQLRQ